MKHFDENGNFIESLSDPIPQPPKGEGSKIPEQEAEDRVVYRYIFKKSKEE